MMTYILKNYEQIIYISNYKKIIYNLQFIRATMSVPLIRCNKKQDTYKLEICKEGINILRKLKHKKLRIIFNIVQKSLSDIISLSHFNSVFMDKQSKQLQAQQQFALTIHKQWKQLSDERVVIAINAYQSEDILCFLNILGYLSASTVIYHQYGPINTNSHLTCMLAQFKKILLNTDIENLDYEIKYKTGFTKKPYFLCLIYGYVMPDPASYFKSIFSFQQNQQNILNEAVNAFLDYFPERSALCLDKNYDQQVKKMGEEFVKDILGRQIFSFQFTGATMQNLCFEICEMVNDSQIKSINLVSVFKKIIANQSSRVQGITMQRYIKGIDQIKAQLPLPEHQLHKIHSDLCQEVLFLSLQDANNCMQFPSYIEIFKQITKKMKQMFKELQQYNEEQYTAINQQCYSLLENLEIQCEEIDGYQMIEDIFNLHMKKLELFESKCVGQNKITYLLRLLNSHTDQIKLAIQTFLQGTVLSRKQSELNVETANQEVQILIQQNRILTEQFQRQLQIINQYKLKFKSEKQISMEFTKAKNKQVTQLKKKIQDLQEQLADKNFQIQQQNNLLEAFQGAIEGKKAKHRFSKEFTQSIKSIDKVIAQLNQSLDSVVQKQQREKQLIKKLDKQKSKFIEDMNKKQQKMTKIQAQLSRAIRQRSKFQQLVQQQRKTLKLQEELQKRNKKQKQQSAEMIQKLSLMQGELMGQKGDIEGELQLYIKAIDHLGEFIKKGKSQNLNNFIKLCQIESLKNKLQTITTKK